MQIKIASCESLSCARDQDITVGGGNSEVGKGWNIEDFSPSSQYSSNPKRQTGKERNHIPALAIVNVFMYVDG